MKKINKAAVLSLCCCFAFAGCTTQPIQRIPLGSYATVSSLVVDGNRGTDEWQAAKRQSVVQYRVGKDPYGRHYLSCMYDADALYLWIKTFYHPRFETKRTVAFGKEPLDAFPVQFLSDDKSVLTLLVACDGVAYVPDLSCAARQPYAPMPVGTGIEVASIVDRDPRRGKGQMVWFSEIKIPLKLLEAVGHRVYLIISGTQCRIFFDPETRSMNWFPNAS